MKVWGYVLRDPDEVRLGVPLDSPAGVLRFRPADVEGPDEEVPFDRVRSVVSIDREVATAVAGYGFRVRLQSADGTRVAEAPLEGVEVVGEELRAADTTFPAVSGAVSLAVIVDSIGTPLAQIPIGPTYVDGEDLTLSWGGMVAKLTL